MQQVARPTTAGAEDSGMRRPRKRCKYTRSACESCKVRKIRCSGTMPCGRCVEHNVECRYPTRFAKTGVIIESSHDTNRLSYESEATHQEFEQLLSSMRHICNGIQSYGKKLKLSAPPKYPLSRQRRSNDGEIIRTNQTYLSNFVHSFNVGRSLLEERGVLSAAALTPRSIPHGDEAEVPQPQKISFEDYEAVQSLLALGQERARRHLTAYTDMIFPAYPCVDLDQVKRTMESVFEAEYSTASSITHVGSVEVIDLEVVKIVLALGMLNGNELANPLATDLETHIVWTTDAIIKSDSAQIEDVVIAALLTIYYTSTFQDLKAYRMIGFAARASLELGLHCERFYRGCTNDPARFQYVRNLFISVTDLDKRCSSMVSLPCSLPERIIDEGVMEVKGDFPFLSTMVSLNGLTSELFELVNTARVESNSKNASDRVDYIDFQAQRLCEDIHDRQSSPSNSSSPLPHPLQLVMEVLRDMRVVSLRMIAHVRPILSIRSGHNRPHSIKILISSGMTIVDLYARAITGVGHEGIGRLWGSVMNHFLLSSIAWMFVAVASSPSTYGPICRAAFHKAIDLYLESPHHIPDQNAKAGYSLLDLKMVAERIQMPRSETLQPSGTALSKQLVDAPTVMEDMIQPFAPANQFDTYGLLGDEYQGLLNGISSSPGLTLPYDLLASFL